jgi:hypothetical protein
VAIVVFGLEDVTTRIYFGGQKWGDLPQVKRATLPKSNSKLAKLLTKKTTRLSRFITGNQIFAAHECKKCKKEFEDGEIIVLTREGKNKYHRKCYEGMFI